jgi:hypothetical protein
MNRPTAEAPVLPDGFMPGCTNWRCSCWEPGRVCDEFMALDGWKYCPRCGWSKELHPAETAVTSRADPE